LVFYYIHKSKYKKVLSIITIVLGVIINFIVYKYNVRFPFWTDVSFYGLLFYCLGYVLKNYKFQIYHAVCSVVIYVVSMILNFKFFDKFMLNNRCDLLYLKLGNPFIYVVSSICAIIFVMYFSKKINTCKIIELFGKNTLVIMGIHIIILQIITKIVMAFSLNNYVNIILIFVLTSVLSLVCSEVINRYFRFFIRLNWRKKEEKI